MRRAAARVFVFAIVPTLVLATTLHAQTGPIKVQAGTTQVVVRLPPGKVEVKRQGAYGTAAPTLDPAGSGKTLISYTARSTDRSVDDSFSYVLDTGLEQEVSLQIEPATFDFDRAFYEKLFKAIFLLFVLAVVLESGLAVVFNWRPFVETFNARATKPLVSFVFAYLFVIQFQLDLMTSILAAASSQAPPPSEAGRIVTALVLAGGSAGINNILIALGFRQRRTPESVAPAPPPSKAWIAFRLARSKADGLVEVFLGPTPAQLPGMLPLVGVIHGTSRPAVRFFFLDRGRFPQVAGYEVQPGVSLSFELVGKDKQGAVLRSPRRDDLVLGAGAIVDFEIQL